MSLSIIGRYNIPGGLQPFGAVQDPNDLDSIYFLMAPGGVWWLYKFTWPSTLVQVVNLDTYLNGKNFQLAAIANDYSSLLGELGTDLHYCITAIENGLEYMWFVDVNLTNGSVTTFQPQYSGGTNSERTFVGYTESGTYFYGYPSPASGASKNWYAKKLGVAGGISGTPNPAFLSHVYWVDGLGFHGFAQDSGASYWRSVNLACGLSAPIDGGTTEQMIGPSGDTSWGIYTGTVWQYPATTGLFHFPPQVLRGWDDNWIYGFGAGIHSPYIDLLFYRKNVVTKQYQIAMLINDHTPNNAIGNEAAFDIWQTGDDSTKRRIFFSYGGSSGIVFTSLAWPPAVDSSVQIDTGGNAIVVSLHTAEEYVYCLHWHGSTQGTCITKLMETELVAGEPEPSIGGIGARLLFKDKRVFFIGVPGYGKYLWWAQPLEPQSLDVGWDGFNTTVFDDEDNTSLNALDDNIYIGSQKGFIRLRGKSPDSWVLDQTLATTGPLSDKTSSVTPLGLIYPRENGLWLFNGFTSVLFFEKGKNLLNNVNWDEYARAFSLWDGRYYRLYYPSGTSVENDRELVVDLIGGIENARGTEGDRVATFGFADLTTNTVYLGDASGNLMTLGGTAAARTFSLTTKEYPVAGLLAAGTFSALHYDIDLAGAILSIIPICDGVEKPAKTITNTTRTRSKVSLPDGNYYRVGFRFEITTDKAVKFYDPWYLV